MKIITGVPITMGMQSYGSDGIGGTNDLRAWPFSGKKITAAGSPNLFIGGISIGSYREVTSDPTDPTDPFGDNFPIKVKFKILDALQYSGKIWKLTDGEGNVATIDFSVGGATQYDYVIRQAVFSTVTTNANLSLTPTNCLHYNKDWYPSFLYTDVDGIGGTAFSDPAFSILPGFVNVGSFDLLGNAVPLWGNSGTFMPKLELDTPWPP